MQCQISTFSIKICHFSKISLTNVIIYLSSNLASNIKYMSNCGVWLIMSWFFHLIITKWLFLPYKLNVLAVFYFLEKILSYVSCPLTFYSDSRSHPLHLILYFILCNLQIILVSCVIWSHSSYTLTIVILLKSL